MIASHKGEIPFFVLILPFLVGIGLGFNLSSAQYEPFLYAAIFLFALAFVLLNLTYKRFNIYKIKWLGGLLLHTLLFLLGWAVITSYTEINNTDHFSKTPADYLLVKINNEPKLTGDILRFTANVEGNVLNGKRTSTSGTLLIAIKDSTAKNLYYGDGLLIPAAYHPIDPPDVPAEFNYKKYLANQNIYYQAFLYPKQFYTLSRNTGNPIIAYSLRLRQRLVEKFKADMHSPEAIAVASTLILGYKADLSNDVLQAYSKTGTIHVLSVSGAHVAIIFVLLNLALGFLERFKYGRSIKAVIIITLIWYYSLLSGFSPAVCRAAVMITMVIIGKTYSRHINTLNILAISAFFLLLYDPLFIVDVGFQLSYLAVFGLVVLQPVVYNWIDIKNKWADKLWAMCSVSIAAQVITFPLSAFYFHQFPVYFLVSNLFIVIPSAIIMYTGIAYLLLPQIPVVSASLAFVLEKSILLMNKVLSVIEHAPFSGINKIWITSAEYILLYVIIISAFYFLNEQRKWLLKLCLGCTLLLVISISLKRWNNLRSESIAFLDLKKHMGLVFRKGNQAVIVSDLTDSDKTYKYSIQPYLDSCQVSEAKICSENSNIQSSFLLKKTNLIEFDNKKLMIFDKGTQQTTLPAKLKLDYLYITGNPDTNIGFLNRNYDYGLLLIDNTNPNLLITRFNEEAKTTPINYRVLKRNKSVIISSE